MQFQNQVFISPGLTVKGTRSTATIELATQVDAKWLLAMRQRDPTAWWLNFIDFQSAGPEIETVKYAIDFEDLGAFTEDTGERTAVAVKQLAYTTINMKRLRKNRGIPTRDVKGNSFGEWPDRLTSIMIAARRTMGVFVRDMLYSSGANGTSGKFSTYQQNITGSAQPLFYPSGHLCDPTEPTGYTFGNLHTGANVVASGNAQAVPGATSFTTSGWETAQAAVFSRLGPGAVPLDQPINFVLGGSAMAPKFRRVFGRILTLDETGVAAVTNIDLGGKSMYGEEVVVPIVTSWLDQHPLLLPNRGGAP